MAKQFTIRSMLFCTFAFACIAGVFTVAWPISALLLVMLVASVYFWILLSVRCASAVTWRSRLIRAWVSASVVSALIGGVSGLILDVMFPSDPSPFLSPRPVWRYELAVVLGFYSLLVNGLLSGLLAVPAAERLLDWGTVDKP